MLSRITLRSRIFLLLLALVMTNVFMAVVTLWYLQNTQRLYTIEIDRDMDALLTAQKLEKALIMQKGFATYYFLNADPSWLELLYERHREFELGIKNAREASFLQGSDAILTEIESSYIRYCFLRDQVVTLYKQGQREKGAKKHWEVREDFHAIFTLCENFKELHEANIANMRKSYLEKAKTVTMLAALAIPLCAILGLGLGLFLYRQVLDPIRRLAEEKVSISPGRTMPNEVQALGRRVLSLERNVDQSVRELEQSREHLIQSEKLALVGKLSASVAHSIRNPLTSVKMRLFSLERSLPLDAIQKEDFDVIAEEIRHLDNIIGHFLEFARPPRLKMQWISPSDVLDMTLELLRHRLESYGVKVALERSGRLPLILADAEQLKEVFVNLFINAMDATGEQGNIRITENVEHLENLGKVAAIRFGDSGPGISEKAMDKIFEPFFSTKEDGTGLGLAITRRILEEHGGMISLHAVEKGAEFYIALPIKENPS